MAKRVWRQSGGKWLNLDVEGTQECLPVGTYTVLFDSCTSQFYLEEIPPFKLPAKLYGDVESTSKRILEKFSKEDHSLGTLLLGEKGSGKTLTGMHLSVLAGKLGMPTIIVAEDHHGPIFNDFLALITVPCLVLFDEFEKVYGYAEQQQLLTLFDGVYKSRKLFVLTANAYSLDRNFIGRPGRIHYCFKFEKLSKEAVEEYCLDNLENKDFIPEIDKVSAIIDGFNFDTLQALVRECNLFKETPLIAAKSLNVSPNTDGTSYRGTVTHPKKKVTYFSRGYVADNPITYAKLDCELVIEGEEDSIDFTLLQQDLTQIDRTSGKYIYEKDGYKITFEANRTRGFSIDGINEKLNYDLIG